MRECEASLASGGRSQSTSSLFDLFYPRPPKPTFDLFLTYFNVFGFWALLGRLWLLNCGILLERAVRIDEASANCRAKSHFQVQTSERSSIFRCPPLRCRPLGPPEECEASLASAGLTQSTSSRLGCSDGAAATVASGWRWWSIWAS